MNILQLRWLRVNSISLDSSVWVKIGQTLLNLFIGGNRVIVCSEASIVRSDVYLFARVSTIHFQWSVAALFQYAFVETFTAKFKFIRGEVIAAVYLTTYKQHLRTSELFLNSSSQALSYHVVCVLHNMFWGRNLLQHQQ